MTSQEERDWMMAAKAHIREIERIGLTARCASGCPCDQAVEVYESGQDTEVASFIERVYPEAVALSEGVL